jgi:hypothetical protein
MASVESMTFDLADCALVPEGESEYIRVNSDRRHCPMGRKTDQETRRNAALDHPQDDAALWLLRNY